MRTTTATILLAALALAACAGGAAPDATAPSPASTTPSAGIAELAPPAAPAPASAAEAMPAAYDTGAAMRGARAREPAPGAAAGEAAVAVIGTPFYWVFKGTVCVASLVIAAPTSALVAVAGDPYGEGIETLGDGVARNCGPPYVLTP